jgi:hypothetical protein
MSDEQVKSDQASGVEQTTGTRQELQQNLEKHLHKRPDAQDLKDRHILHDTTAASTLQARQAELERQMITDNLKKVSVLAIKVKLQGQPFDPGQTSNRPLCHDTCVGVRE